MIERAEFIVPDMSCEHCRRAVTAALTALPAVASVRVDLETKRAAVEGEGLDDAALRAVIIDAGYQPEP